MRNAIAPQLIGYYLPGFTVMSPKKTPKEALRRFSVPAGLQEYVDYIAILIDSAPEVMLDTSYFHEYFVNKKCITISPLLTPQSPTVLRSKFVTPQPDRFMGYGNAALS